MAIHLRNIGIQRVVKVLSFNLNVEDAKERNGQQEVEAYGLDSERIHSLG